MMGDVDATEGGAGVFDLTRRGYDRRQVDDHLTHLMVQLSEAERARTREQGRANRAESELAEARERLRAIAESGGSADAGQDGLGGGHQGFGLRVEKLLRAAEQEAAETREGATREARGLLEQARADAEAHRHDVEQSLIARNAEVDRKAARRKVELDERERQVAEHSAGAREESERVLLDARNRAEQIEADARMQAAEHLADTEKSIETRRSEADDELVRLRTLRRDVRGDLARVLAVLAGEFERPTGDSASETTALAPVEDDPTWFAAAEERSEDPAPGSTSNHTTDSTESPRPIFPAAGR